MELGGRNCAEHRKSNENDSQYYFEEEATRKLITVYLLFISLIGVISGIDEVYRCRIEETELKSIRLRSADFQFLLMHQLTSSQFSVLSLYCFSSDGYRSRIIIIKCRRVDLFLLAIRLHSIRIAISPYT